MHLVKFKSFPSAHRCNIIVQHHFHCLNLWPLCQGENNNAFILITGSRKVTNLTNFVEVLTNTKMRPRLSHFRLILGN